MRKRHFIFTLVLGVFAAVGQHGAANAAVKTAGYVYYTKGGNASSDVDLVFSEDGLNYTAVSPAGRRVGNWGWADDAAKAQQYGKVHWESPSVGNTTYALTNENYKAAVYFDYIPLTVKFSPNGGTGSMAQISGQNYDSQFQLSACTFTKPGYHCGGWSNATTGQLSPGATVKGSQFWNATSKQYDATLSVMWAPNTYSVRFDGNGATGGSMEDEPFTYDATAKELSPNAFTKTGFAFIGWATNGAPDKVVYVDRQPVRNLTPDSDGVVMLHACWEKGCTVTFYDAEKFGHGTLKVEYVSTNGAATAPAHPVHTGYTADGWDKDFSKVTADLGVTAKYVNNAYTVTFDANGGTGDGPADKTYHYDMYETEGPLPTPIYDPPKNYATFVGWSTNRKDTVGFMAATNLTSEANGKVKLYAIWTYDVGEWSRVLDCNNLMFTNGTAEGSIPWQKRYDSQGAVEESQSYAYQSGIGSIDSQLYAEARGSGTLTFWYRLANKGDWLTFEVKELGISEQLSVEQADKWVKSEKRHLDLPNGSKLITISFGHYGLPEACLDCVTWIPDSCTIEFNPNGGENAPTNITVDCNSMEYLPEEVPTRLGYGFLGWATNAPPSEVVDYLPGDSYRNNNSTNTVTMYAVWKKLATVPVPAAVKGLVHDGTVKTGVPAGTGYSIVGNVATNAGDYVATATLLDGYAWEDFSLGPTNIAWSIAKGTNDISGVTFPDATFLYDGEEHSFGIVGELPEGVSVVYSGDPTNRTEIGTNTVTASFVVADTNNWSEIETTLTARLMIVRKIRPVPADEDLYSDGEIGEFDGLYAATYSGWLRDPSTGAIIAQLQVKTTAARSGRASKSTITVTPLGGKKKSYKTEVWPGGNPMDSFGVVYGASALDGTLNGIPGIPNGAQVEAAKDFAKAKDPVEKMRKNEIPQGCRTLALATADGYDSLSVTIDKNGKAKVKGTLTEGVSLSLSVQGALGKDAFAVPVTYSKSITPKTGGDKRPVTFGFVLWIEIGPGGGGAARMTNVTGDRWMADGSDVGQTALVRPADGSHRIVFSVPADFPQVYRMETDDGHSLMPTGETIVVTGRKWISEKTVGSVKYDADSNVLYVKTNGKPPANLTKLKLTYTEKTGLVKGSFRLYYFQLGKLKADSAAVTGVAVNGRFIGNVVIRKKGAMPIAWQ